MSNQIDQLTTNQAGHLEIGGCDTLDLAKEYGTPLVVYDVKSIRDQIHHFQKVFEDNDVDYAVSYASKAFACIAMFQLINQEHGHIDVVSGGELYTAIQAGFPMDHVSFHGNNKSREELEMAVDHQIGVIMLDNFHEIDLLKQVLEERNSHINVMLRVTPGVSAHTHEYDQTGQVDSKFGFDLKSGQARQALDQVLADPRMTMLGIHAHIGSQIFEVKGFEMAATTLVDTLGDWHEEIGYTAKVVNVGGGFGIRYTQADDPIAPEMFVDAIVKAIKKRTHELGLPMPAVWIEPGRSIAGPAGYNLYTVGSRKDVPGIRSYVTVDGGMGDNIRPALYQAKYEAVLAKNPKAPIKETVRVAGKYCESGDILIQKQDLPATQPGDVLAMLATGAYGYAMASNYNRNPRPAVVFVENGHSQVAIKRESFEDLVHLDEPFNLSD
ncbi:MAG: diaminopimelate decarboxylase [Lentilactobacillus diolivorans]|jgi:diaminopimelate decarboxylase|uniref:Diaminopimelate decarboxylase n=2 Tax=Lentilactobacillus diolivorans TaxID=179838 RepID=A0A0R1S5R2_9LACO|nr:diaminopimelate decarboxylase [Lentilactobacillus diolivorans]KRL62836.1 diaminopimelate decarboxylase [Lentilactobacillus diolivorans DSM 14421]MCH4165656.1 diaminopimelate decarboxylase [Lentilactobacillus diolivorans]RRG02305.1 MAG: diaminopimelate decarboxylase [Lactobacillus sp.]GEP23423.1 diaminopimelate decarboxylase [Lentilactobacillus diolivorans]